MAHATSGMRRGWRTGTLVSAGILLLASGATVRAQSVTGDQLKALQAQIDALQKQVKQLEAQQQQSTATAATAKQEATAAKSEAAQAKASAAQAKVTAATAQTQVANLPMKATDKDPWFFRHKEGDPLTFETPGGEITGYGNFDVSFDAASKSVTGTFTSPANTGGPGGVVLPNGNFG